MSNNLTFWSDGDLPFNCPSGCHCLQPDPDIAGIGVIWAFIATSSLATVAAFLGLWLQLKRPSSNSLSGKIIPHNRVDRLCNKWLPGSLSLKQGDFWSEVFRAVVLSLSDTQLISGLAVISTGLIRMSSGDLSMYHFWIIADLAWLANNSQFLGFEVLRRWLVDKQLSSHYGVVNSMLGRGPYFLLRMTRFVLMFLMFGLMLTLTIFAGGDWGSNYWNCPAKCIAYKYPGSTDGTGGSARQWMIADLVLLVWGYVDAMVYLLGPTASTRHQLKRTVKSKMSMVMGGTIAEVLMWIWDWFGSSAFTVLFEVAWVGIGVRNLINDWKDGQRMLKHPDQVPDYLQCPPVPGGESTWGFGQIFPILMLLLPILAFLEAYEKAKESHKTTKTTTHCGSCGSTTSGASSSVQLLSIPVHTQQPLVSSAHQQALQPPSFPLQTSTSSQAIVSHPPPPPPPPPQAMNPTNSHLQSQANPPVVSRPPLVFGQTQQHPPPRRAQTIAFPFNPATTSQQGHVQSP